MAHKKKNRKGGMLAPRKSPDFKADRVSAPDRVKKGKGHRSGSRQQEAKNAPLAAQESVNTDKRLGSKKPVQLIAPAKPVSEPKVTETIAPITAEPVDQQLLWHEELSSLEQDSRLGELLDRSDAGESLDEAQQQWLDERLSRIGELIELLGLDDDDDDEDWDEDDWSDDEPESSH